MAQSVGGTKSADTQKARLPPRRGQIKVKIMSKLVNMVVKVASAVGKVLSGKKLPPPPWSSSSISTVRSRSPPLSAVRWDPSKSHPRYLADFASKLARDGNLQDFAMVVETAVGGSGVEASQFKSALRAELVEKGVSGFFRDGKVQSFVNVLRKLDEFGFPPLEIFDGSGMELLRRECHRILKCGDVEELVELVEALAGFGFSIKELMKPSDVIKICVRKRNPKMAIRYACTLPHAHMLFCDTIYAFGKKGDLESALTAYELSKQNSNSINMYLYRTTIDVCGRCHDHMKSREIYEDLLSHKVTPNVYVVNSVMNVNAHDLSYTFSVYRDMQNLGVQADMASYNILLKACCLAGRVELAQDIYKEVRHLESRGLLKLDVFTYSTIVKVLADAKLWQMALKVKDDMLSAGVTPNTVTWSSLISACANAGLVEKAVQLFEEMLLAGCEPNSQCCNILLHACVEASQYDRAFRLFESLKINQMHKTFEDGKGNRESNTSTGVSSRSQSSNLYGLNFAKELPFMPTTATYNILMKACGSDYYHAKALMYEMNEVGLSPNQITWSILIDICGSSGNVEGALKILRSMRETGIEPDVVAYTTVIKVCVESANVKVAFALFAEMKRNQIQPNLVTYNTLLRARSRYGSSREVKQCLAVYQDMRRAGYKPNDYYLKQLIEEWCEGVIQGNNQNLNQGAFSSSKTDRERPQSLLLEKVAEHLQKHIAESLTIDLQGLTKVEARIVVLAVLQMIREKYSRGYSLKDDMIITLGIGKFDGVPDEQELEVKYAITKLLQDELWLEVLPQGLKIAPNKQMYLESPGNSTAESDDLESDELSTEMRYSTRRPVVVMQRLQVTRKSLQHWLRRRNSLRR
ncbi:Tetratricopeptide-like helical domain containing protein [Trema orientale]|uniref:Tetratricopeptide-like helical domain containing protein n=1 Tax=Trema orientale TaxID=63057 RepID=A0A2P5FXF5_TREOI|nr:Tetratricopeptide-like helical domain containing protein [Trema orientale]